jgi:glycosyltransferase involved in cell wall biosynthesis
LNKRILYVTDTLGTGGAERQLTLLVKYLPAEWECRVWSLGNGSFAKVMRNDGIVLDVRERRWRYDIEPLLDLWQMIMRWHPIIVHSWGWVCSAAVAPLCRLLRIPWIDGSIRVGRPPMKHKVRARLALALADRVIANSQAGLDACNISRSKGRVVYNGFDPERLPLTERVERDDSKFTAVMVGRMSIAKDFDSFIRAARMLNMNDERCGWHFQALGQGPQRASLISNAGDLIEKGIMEFPDAGLEVLPYVRQAHVGVLMTRPPEQEGCSNAILEYMACGLPVVCSNSAGNRELVKDGETGFTVHPQDVDGLIDKLLWLREHQQDAHAMGTDGRQRFMEEFTVEKLIEKTSSVYRELLPFMHISSGSRQGSSV